MNMLGFTAEASLCKTKGRYQYVATRTHGQGRQKVVPQLPGKPYSWERANAIRDIIGFGKVFCVPDCSRAGSQTAFCPMVCGWWPY